MSTAVPNRAHAQIKGDEFFETKIRPLLAEHCFRCHSAKNKRSRGGLQLDSKSAVMRGGESGKILVVGEPEKSKLIEAIRYQNPDLQMPPRAKLPDQAIADLTAWVKMGAPWPGSAEGKTATVDSDFDLLQRKKDHWCWQPLHNLKAPAVKQTAWPRSDIDRFLLAKLESKRLKPADDASKQVMLRRVYFDLTGLPPTPDEVEAFLKDDSKDAFEKLIDRLLASPRFGERWGRHWLDLVRYAESRGHEFDYTAPNAFEYRDYVIRAFNADVPYNQFVVEHLAGDLLDEPRMNAEGFNESILGTGFWYLGEQVHSPVDISQDKADRYDNMLDVMSKTFLGLTVACARCHDHKFDAISTRDYYALFGFLESSSYRMVPFDTLEHNRKIVRELEALRTRQSQQLRHLSATLLKPGIEQSQAYLLAATQLLHMPADKAGPAVEAEAARHKLDAHRLGRWHEQLRSAKNDELLSLWVRAAAPKADVARVLDTVVAKQPQTRQPDARVIVDYGQLGHADWLSDGFVFRSVTPGDIRLDTKKGIEVIDDAAGESDPALDVLELAPGTQGEPGALGNPISAGRTLRTPTFTLKTGRVYYRVKGKGRVYASVDGHVMINGPLHRQLVRNVDAREFQWIEHDLRPYVGRNVHFEFTPQPRADFAVARVVEAESGPANAKTRVLETLPLEGCKSPADLAAAYANAFRTAAQAFAAGKVSKEQAALAGWLCDHADLFIDEAGQKELQAAVTGAIEEQAKLRGQLKKRSRLAPAMLDGNGVNVHVFIRGSYKNPGDEVPRRFLEALTGPRKLQTATSGRLKLARQMTDPELNPLVPRVIVNRIWHHLFGRGIVPSVDNFGVLGEAPTHPELLDHLAIRFVREDWSIKKMIRTLMLTRAYGMASHADDATERADPKNELLHRMNIKRLEGEAIRDSILAVSGRLDNTMFGPSVPVHLTEFQDGRGRPGSGPIDGNGRRSIYLSVRRNFLAPMLLAFDAPIPFSSVGRRTVSNVPAQALILLNDPFVHQQSEVWAKNLPKEGDVQAKVRTMYLQAFARPPSQAERQACQTFIEQQATLHGGNSTAAWRDLAHVLFNAKEFIFLQ